MVELPADVVARHPKLVRFLNEKIGKEDLGWHLWILWKELSDPKSATTAQDTEDLRTITVAFKKAEWHRQTAFLH